jgi:AAA family ATP:ADP antiporter
VLFTVLEREEKYKAKNVIDVVVFRGADALGGWLFAGLRALGLGLPAISLAAIPAAGAWLALSLWLGRASRTGRGSRASPSP